VREVWIHAAEDVGASWQAYSTARTQHFEVMSNLYSYTLGRTAAGVTYPPLTPPPPPASTVTLNVARIEYSGNWDPEPAAWEKFEIAARYSHAATIHAAPVKIAELDAAKTPVAHMTGTAAFTLTEDEKTKLKAYLEAGGSLLADATGGSDAFGKSFRELAESLYPDTPLTEIAATSPVLARREGTAAPVARRFSEMPANRMRSIAITQLKRGGRPVILFSSGDLTAGLSGLKTWGIHGYTVEASQRIVWNALTYLTAKPAGAR
jgi:hypothetical protein